jgi:hypothetical protein
VEFGRWFYASDNASQELLLYDAVAGTTSRPDVIGLIERAINRNCTLHLWSVGGFDGSRIILRVADRRDEEGLGSSCIGANSE